MPYSKSVYKELTRRAINGDRIALWCEDYRHAKAEFNEYEGYLLQLCESMRMMYLPAARKTNLAVEFPSGGLVGFISASHECRGVHVYEVGLNDELIEVVL